MFTFRLPLVFLLSTVLFLQSGNLFSKTAAPIDKIKAAYIYQFTRFVKWPETDDAADGLFTICVIGKDSIGNELKPLIGRQQGKQLIIVKFLKSIKDSSGCKIIYVADSERNNFKEILNYLYLKPILTVSSIPGFAEQGGIIDFITVDKKVRLEINIAAAKASKLGVSAKLLEISKNIFYKDVMRTEG